MKYPVLMIAFTDKMRFLDLKVNDAFTNMATDEALTKSKGEGASRRVPRQIRLP